MIAGLLTMWSGLPHAAYALFAWRLNTLEVVGDVLTLALALGVT